jgi:hypothetical protein
MTTWTDEGYFWWLEAVHVRLLRSLARAGDRASIQQVAILQQKKRAGCYPVPNTQWMADRWLAANK